MNRYETFHLGVKIGKDLSSHKKNVAQEKTFEFSAIL